MRNKTLPRFPRHAVALALSLLPLTATLAPERAYAADSTQQSIAVQTVPARRGAIAKIVRAYGVLGAAPGNVVAISVPYSAHLTRWLVAPGMKVQRGTPLFYVMADPAAVLANNQARSAVTLAQGELSRTQALYRQQLATQSQLATATKALEDARQALAAQQQLGVAPGPKAITAPSAGVVLQITAAQGDLLQPGAPIMQLSSQTNTQASAANLVVGVEPGAAQTLRAGDQARVGSLSALATTTQLARVLSVGGAVDTQNQLVNVALNVPAVAGGLLPGTKVFADIAEADGTHWLVPRAAVLSNPKGPNGGAYLYQIDQGKAHRIAVRIAVEQGDTYGIDGNLNASLPVVSVGNYELQEGASVKATGGAAQ